MVGLEYPEHVEDGVLVRAAGVRGDGDIDPSVGVEVSGLEVKDSGDVSAVVFDHIDGFEGFAFDLEVEDPLGFFGVPAFTESEDDGVGGICFGFEAKTGWAIEGDGDMPEIGICVGGGAGPIRKDLALIQAFDNQWLEGGTRLIARGCRPERRGDCERGLLDGEIAGGLTCDDDWGAWMEQFLSDRLGLGYRQGDAHAEAVESSAAPVIEEFAVFSDEGFVPVVGQTDGGLPPGWGVAEVDEVLGGIVGVGGGQQGTNHDAEADAGCYAHA